MQRIKQKNDLFWIVVGFTAIFSIWAVISPVNLTETLWSLVYIFHGNFHWFTVVMPLIILLISLYLAFSKYGQIKLGGKDEKPEFSRFSWMAMLFTAGIGVGLVNFGVAEPLSHYLNSPLGLAGGYDEITAAKNALSLTMFTWGLPAWSIYTISGLVIGYFAYHKGAKLLPGTPIRQAFCNHRWADPVSKLANVLAAGAASLTVAASIGLGIFQVKNGINSVFNLNLSSLSSSIIILIILFLLYTLAAVLPIGKGMKVLGDINIIIAIGLLLFILFLGNTEYFMSTFMQTLKSTFIYIVPFSFENYIFYDKMWFFDWPNTTFIWWISWTPFLGVFIAKISKGRTIKEVILSSILIPTIFLIMWFSVFGGYGLLEAIVGEGKIVNYIQNNPNDVYLSFIMVLQSFPLFPVMGVVFIVLIVVFLATTVTSAIISLAVLTSNGNENPKSYRLLIWSIIITMVSFANVATGTLDGVRAVAVIIGIPYMLFLFISIAGMMKQIRLDYKEGAIKHD